MVHYTNASSIEKNRRYLVIKGRGLAWLFLQVGGVGFDGVEHTNIGSGLGVYRKEITEGEHNKNRAIKCKTKQDAAICCARGDLTYG